MGGYGSGRHSGRGTTEGYRKLDVRELHRAGALSRVSAGSWQWKRDGELVASIGYEATRAAVVLDYRVSGEPMRYAVGLEWTPCRYGGARPWFRCPGVGCGRRCAVLYGGRVFACRRCYGLAYECQRENRSSRLMRKAWRYKARLGEDGEKPPRMHWRTYERLVEMADTADAESLMALAELPWFRGH